jgi:hypothetical protein
VWVDGESWADSAPLTVASSQYLDCRGEAFERGSSALVILLRSLAERVIPNHFANPLLEPFPQSCLSVALPPRAAAGAASGPSAAILKVGSYSSLESLLDELYANYLSEHYEPLTYGKSWMLAEARSDAFSFVVAPWSWLAGAPIDRQWVRGHTPADCHLSPGTRWMVTTPPADAYGLAIADVRLVDALRATAKTDLGLRRDGYLSVLPVSDVDAAAFPCTMVCRGRSRFWHAGEVEHHMALVQVRPVPEEELQWYLSNRAP